jgi:hypothetical protein
MSIFLLLVGFAIAAELAGYKIAYQAAMDKFEALRHAMMPILKTKMENGKE